eukprot:434909_1
MGSIISKDNAIKKTITDHIIKKDGEEYIFKHISSSTSKYQASIVLDHYIRNILSNNNLNIIFPTDLKYMIIKLLFFSCPIPNVLLFLSSKIRRSTTSLGTGGIQCLFNYDGHDATNNVKRNMYQARQMLFDSKQILNCTIEDIDNK